MFEDVMRQRRRKEEINENNRNSACVLQYVYVRVFKGDIEGDTTESKST